MRGHKSVGGHRKARPKEHLTHRKTTEARQRDDKRLEKRMIRDDEDEDDVEARLDLPTGGRLRRSGGCSSVRPGVHWHDEADYFRVHAGALMGANDACRDPECWYTAPAADQPG